jgi:GntR family transcriptional regulator
VSRDAAPRYEEIASYLRGLVANAAPGDRLPSDAELCERFGVSRMTARQAVQQLVQDHLVERRRGAGTFISPRRVLRTLGSPLSFTESMRRRGMKASSRLLHRGPVTPTEDEAEALGLRPGDKAYLLERLRLADGVPMAIERAVLPIPLVESLAEDIEEGSLHAAFEHAGRVPTKALAAVTARRATRREAQLLELPAGGLILSERRTITDEQGRPLERTETCYAAERYSFEAVLYRRSDD